MSINRTNIKYKNNLPDERRGSSLNNNFRLAYSHNKNESFNDDHRHNEAANHSNKAEMRNNYNENDNTEHRSQEGVVRVTQQQKPNETWFYNFNKYSIYIKDIYVYIEK